MEQDNGLKIIGLQVTGVRKITAIAMQFVESGLIKIVGGNQAGKTTVLDALEILFTGNKAAPKDIIQHGKNRAEITGEVGGYKVKRVITEKSNRLEITNKDGLEMTKKPQAFLDTLINDLTFNPRPFLNRTPEQKLRFMMDLLQIDFTEQNKKISDLEQERLLVGREIKSIGEIAEVEKVEKVDINDLLNQKTTIESANNEQRKNYDKEKEEEFKEIVRFNDEQKDKAMNIVETKKEYLILENQKNEIKKQIEELQKELTLKHSGYAQKIANFSSLPQPEELKPLEVNIDAPEYQSTENITNQIKEAGEINREADEYEKYLEKLTYRENKTIISFNLTDKIIHIRNVKKKILSEIDMPVPGLEIREEGLYHDNIFSENWSESEGLRISSELCIAMKPKLRAICIDKGESYDSDTLKAQEQWAIEHNIQVFITIVDDIPEEMDEGVFYIEEGNLKENVNANL